MRGWLRPRGSFRTQLVVLTACVTTLGVVLLTLLVQAILARTAVSNADTALRDRAAAVIASTRSAADGGIDIDAAQLEAGVAVYDTTGRLVAGSAPAALSERYEDLSGTSRLQVVSDPRNRILAEPFTTSSGAAGVVVVTERLAPYEQVEEYALAVSIGAGLLLVVVTSGLAGWVTRRALAPVAAMARTAEEWSEHDLARRFDLGPPANEITALGHTLDVLLDRVSAAIRSEQRLTGELAHELRTPLAAVQGSADLMRLHPDLPPDLAEDLEEVRQGTRRMADTITSLLALARSETAHGAESCLVAEAVGEVLAGAGLSGATVDVPEEVWVALPQGVLVRAVAPLVENASRYADSVRIRAHRLGSGMVEIQVEDDGPGVDPGRAEEIFAPGATTGTHGGAGLGLSLARRIVRSSGGDVVLDSAHDPTRFVLTLPAA